MVEKQERGFAALLSILFGKHELEDVFKLSFFYMASWFTEAVAHKWLPEEEECLAAWSVEVFASVFLFYFIIVVFIYLFECPHKLVSWRLLVKKLHWS